MACGVGDIKWFASTKDKSSLDQIRDDLRARNGRVGKLEEPEKFVEKPKRQAKKKREKQEEK